MSGDRPLDLPEVRFSAWAGAGEEGEGEVMIRVVLSCSMCNTVFHVVSPTEAHAEATRATPDSDRLCDACLAATDHDREPPEYEDDDPYELRCQNCGDELCDGKECVP